MQDERKLGRKCYGGESWEVEGIKRNPDTIKQTDVVESRFPNATFRGTAWAYRRWRFGRKRVHCRDPW